MIWGDGVLRNEEKDINMAGKLTGLWCFSRGFFYVIRC